MESKPSFNINHLLLSIIGGFAIGAYIFGTKKNKIREKIEREIADYSNNNEIINSIKNEETQIIKENIISALEKIISELKTNPTDTHEEN